MKTAQDELDFDCVVDLITYLQGIGYSYKDIADRLRTDKRNYCYQCKFFHADTVYIDVTASFEEVKEWHLENLDREEEYKCRRFPPNILYEKNDADIKYLCRHPSISLFGWCGEFQGNTVTQPDKLAVHELETIKANMDKAKNP